MPLIINRPAQDEVNPPVGPPGIDDDAGWSPFQTVAIIAAAVLAAPAPAQPYQFQDDSNEAPTFVATGQQDGNEDYWPVPGAGPPWPTALTIYQRLPYLPDPEEIPAGSLFGQQDEDFNWLALLGPPRPVPGATWQPLPYDPDPEELPAGSLRGLGMDEDFPGPLPAPALGQIYQPLPYQPAPEELPAGSLSGPGLDEDPGAIQPPPPTASFSWLTASDDDLPVAVAAEPAFDEDFSSQGHPR